MKYLLIILALIGGVYAGLNYGRPQPSLVYIAEAEEVRTFPSIPTAQPSPIPTTTEIVSEIAKVFEGEGKSTVVRAINCFYSESGLRHDAVGVNKNGTKDGGVAQINDVHKMSLEDRLNYKKNIAKAYQIYKSRGNWSAWYGEACN